MQRGRELLITDDDRELWYGNLQSPVRIYIPGRHNLSCVFVERGPFVQLLSYGSG